MLLEINKPNKDHLFIVVNFPAQLWDTAETEMNTIVLNSYDIQEFKHKLMQSKAKGKHDQFTYWLCFANNLRAIDSLYELLSFMKAEGFNYIVTEEQFKMYSNKLVEDCTKDKEEGIV